MAYIRKCANFIESFRDWTLDRSQVSELLIDWSAIWTLAAVLRRRIALTRTSAYLGSWDCYPFLYVMVVGPPGVGKTTAIRYAFDLLDQVPTVGKPPTFITVEGLIDDMIKSSDSSSYLVIEEFGDIMIKDTGGKMYQFLTSVYDGKANIRQKTLQRQLEYADKPCLNMFAGTTPEWISDNIPVNTLNGGFGSRCIWLYIPGLRRRRMYYEKEMQAKDFLTIEKNLVADLNHIAAALEGDYVIEKSARDWMEDWNSKIIDNVKYKRISGYIMRKPVFVHKLAMILHTAYTDDKELVLKDFTNAIKLIESIEPTLPRIFEGVGKNEYSLEMRDLLIHIKENPCISEAELRDAFKNAAGPAKLSELIEGLLLANLAESKMDGNNKRIFKAIEKEVMQNR